MTQARKFTVYKTLTEAMRRSKISNPGKVATLLLQVFLERNGKLTAQFVEDSGVLEDKKTKTRLKFSEWREPLTKAGWLKEYNFELAKRRGSGSIHEPGAKLIPHLNREKLNAEILVTQEEMNSRIQEVTSVMVTQDEMHSRIDEVTSGMVTQEQMRAAIDASEAKMAYFCKDLIEKVDSPWTPEKQEKYLKRPDSLLSLVQPLKEPVH